MKEEKVFKDPIHQYIYIQNKILWDLVNTKELQRLRRIKQLGTSYFTYHGAEHSRFSHSLGVYEITRKVISQFERNNYKGCNKEESLLAMIAALLHDIGHGPYSHSTEMIFDFNHENWTEKIILGETEVNDLLTKVDKALPQKIVDIIKKEYSNSIAVNLISSQLDADRMDYLLRDAYYTGVNYGTFDLERILRVLRPFENMLVVKESGMHTIEDYLMSRYQMYWQVYFHPVTRSGEILLKKIFMRAKYLYNNQYKFNFLLDSVERLISGNIEVNKYLQLDDNLFTTLINLWTEEKDKILADLSSRFLNRRLFKYMEFNSKDYNKVQKISGFFTEHNINPDYYLEIDLPTDLPYDIYYPNDAERISPIYLLTDDNRITEISNRSTIIKSITGKIETKNRFFFPMDIIEDKHLIKQFESLKR